MGEGREGILVCYNKLTDERFGNTGISLWYLESDARGMDNPMGQHGGEGMRESHFNELKDYSREAKRRAGEEVEGRRYKEQLKEHQWK